MKQILMLLALLMSFSVWADSVDVKSYWFNGQSPEANLQLNTEKTRIEYRTVRVMATCYRYENRRQCTNQPGQCRDVCNNGQCRRVCSPPRQVCRDVQVRIPYTCYRMEQRPFEVHDYYVDTRVQLNFDLAGLNGGVGEKFNVRMDGERESFTVDGSKNYVILLKDSRRSEFRNGGVKNIDLNYDLGFVSAKAVQEVLGSGIKNVSLKNGILRFELGLGFNMDEFIQNVKVYQSRRLSTDILIFDRNLLESEIDISTLGSSSVVSIDLNRLGIQIPDRTRVILNTQYNTQGLNVLNKDEVKVEATANWIFSK